MATAVRRCEGMLRSIRGQCTCDGALPAALRRRSFHAPSGMSTSPTRKIVGTRKNRMPMGLVGSPKRSAEDNEKVTALDGRQHHADDRQRAPYQADIRLMTGVQPFPAQASSQSAQYDHEAGRDHRDSNHTRRRHHPPGGGPTSRLESDPLAMS